MKIKAWYGSAGALMTDAAIPGANMPRLCEDSAKFYGGPYLVAESMSKSTAKIIADALGLEWVEAKGGHLVKCSEFPHKQRITPSDSR